MVLGIRRVELAMGGEIKSPTNSEKNIKIVRKSIHLAKNLNKGDLIIKDDLIMLRPGDGISPMEIDNLVNRPVNKSLQSGHKLNWKDIK